MSRMSRNKGKAGEREAAELLRNHGFGGARRGMQFRGGPDSPDVVGLPGHHVEVKRCESLSVYVAMDQANEDRREGEIPLILHRRNNKNWLAILPATDYLRLVRRCSSDSQFCWNEVADTDENSCSMEDALNPTRSV